MYFTFASPPGCLLVGFLLCGTTPSSISHTYTPTTNSRILDKAFLVFPYQDAHPLKTGTGPHTTISQCQRFLTRTRLRSRSLEPAFSPLS
ncbi:hypothetical protein F5X96DRAFT_614152 [Biscogniauxia mediterranea]|nr:hypothetical protein F5X96DRAFT_614152 [Biscogniauxia mediterranea]